MTVSHKSAFFEKKKRKSCGALNSFINMVIVY